MTRRALVATAFCAFWAVAARHPACAEPVSANGVVANTAALQTYKGGTDIVLREGVEKAGDGGRAFYHHVATRCQRPDGGMQIAAADGGCWMIDAATPISPVLFGARCAGKDFDDTPAIQAALDTTRTVHFTGLGPSCTISKSLILKTPGQLVIGEDRVRTRLAVAPGFAGPGVLVFQTGEPGPVIRDLAIAFEQPPDAASTSLAALHSYPPAILAHSTPRFELDHLGCYAATTCVDMTGNSGGATIADFQMSAFKTGIEIDGSLDTVRLLEVHAWPFDTTARQLAIMLASVTWVKAAKVDDFKVVGGLFLGGKVGFDFSAGVGGTATGSLTNVDFDGEHHSIVMSAGNISVNGGYFAAGPPGSQDIAMTGGNLGIFGATIGCAGTSAAAGTPTISVAGALTTLTIVGSPSMICQSQRAPILTANGGTIIFSDNTILVTPNIPYAPRIDIRGATRITAIGNRMGDKGTGEGTFISIEKDDFNRVIGNAAPGWSYKLAGRPMPVSALVASPGMYFGN